MRCKLLIFLFLCVLISCVDTHKKLFVSKVNTENLKQILARQQCHNKAIFIFDPSCPHCMFYLQKEYSVMQNKFQDSLDYVFISVDTIPFEKYKKFFHSIGIETGYLLSLQKNNQDYLQTNEQVISKTIRYVFSNQEDIHIKGFPVSAIANKENRLKLEYYRINDSTTVISPKPWHRFYSSSLNEIDFNRIDDCF